MTLGEIISVVTTRTGLLESEDIAACRLFAQRRHSTIYNDALWKDALREFDYVTTLNGLKLTQNWQGLDIGNHIDPNSLSSFLKASPSSAIYFKSLNDAYGRISLPLGSERVVAIRSINRRLNVQSREIFYRFNQDRFYSVGLPCDFVELNSEVFSTPFIQSDRLYLQSDSPSDAGKTIRVKFLQSNGMAYSDTFTLGGSTNIIPAGATYGVNGIYNLSGLVIGDTYTYTKGSSDASFTSGSTALTDTGTFIATATTATLESIGDVSTAVTATLSWIPCVPLAHNIGNGEVFTTSQAGSLTAVLDISSIVKPTTTGNVTLMVRGASDYILAISPTDTTAPIVPRIQLVNPPSQDVTLRFLVKMKCPALSDDNDQPAVRNMEDCLISFVMADMLEYDKNFDAAQLKYKEAAALLAQLKDVEALQSANNQRFIPESGYAIPYSWHSYGQFDELGYTGVVDTITPQSSISVLQNQSVFAGHYGGLAPTFTPSVSAAIATDMDSPNRTWLWYSNSWH